MGVAGLLLAGGLAGCAGGPPALQQTSPNGIELYWYTGQRSLDEAQAEAQNHCQSWGKRAVLVRESTDGGVVRARFACR